MHSKLLHGLNWQAEHDRTRSIFHIAEHCKVNANTLPDNDRIAELLNDLYNLLEERLTLLVMRIEQNPSRDVRNALLVMRDAAVDALSHASSARTLSGRLKVRPFGS